MPSRSIGWSSTARMRIKLGPVLMILFRSLIEKPKTGPGGEHLVSDRPWNAQLDFRAGPKFVPDRQLRSKLFGPLGESWYPPMPRTSGVFNDAWIHALSIVAEA